MLYILLLVKKHMIELREGRVVVEDLSETSAAQKVLHRKNSSKKEKVKRGSALTQK